MAGINSELWWGREESINESFQMIWLARGQREELGLGRENVRMLW